MKQEIINLLKNGKNPIDSDNTIEELAKAYISKDYFYNGIVKAGSESKPVQSYPKRDMDILYSSLFNLWKHNVLNLSDSEKKKKMLTDNYNGLINVLKCIPDISTYEEFCQINEKYPIIRECGIIYPDGNWIFLSSRYVDGTREQDMEAKYRLYINTEANDLYKIVSAFIYKCYDNNLPFDLKFAKFAEDLNIRTDSIVIWADEETLFEYLKILNEIKQKRPDIISRCKTPPILTMQINEWIGFGEEPPESSYTDYRVELLRNSIEKAIVDWIVLNENTTINYGKSKFSIKEYITAKCVKEKIKKTKYASNNELYVRICESIKDEVILAIKNGNKKVEYTEGRKKLTFSFKSSKEDICNMLIKSQNSKRGFFENIRNNIKKGSKENGISSENFAFSIQSEEAAKDKITGER